MRSCLHEQQSLQKHTMPDEGFQSHINRTRIVIAMLLLIAYRTPSSCFASYSSIFTATLSLVTFYSQGTEAERKLLH